MRYLKANQIMDELKISRPTLKTWKDSGKIKYKKISDKKYLYDIDSVYENKETKNKLNIIYARVSSGIQKEDLNRQISIIKEFAIKNGVQIDEVFSDIGSGMSSNRNALNRMINLILEGNVENLYISFKDRLTRFGFNYFENLFAKFGTKIIVLDDDNFRDKNMENELTKDLISIIHYYSMRIYTNRRKKFKEIKKNLEENI